MRLSLGTATLALSSFDPNSAQTKEIGTTNYKFTGVRVTAGSVEQVRLWSVRFNQSGSKRNNYRTRTADCYFNRKYRSKADRDCSDKRKNKTDQRIGKRRY